MHAGRGGLDTDGPSSPEIGLVVARNDGLAPGWSDELRSGDPTGPNWLADSVESFCRPAKKAPKRDGEAVEGEPTFEPESAGEPNPESDCRGSSSAFRENRRIFS